jgi:hypothetical protein
MPFQGLLTEPQRLAFNAPATDERGMVRHYSLIPDDLALINRRRGDANRLGFALQLCYLRFPGRILQQGEQPPAALCAFVAEQLGLDPLQFGDYGEREQTRREHVLEIQTALGLRPLSHSMYREIAAWLLPTALATDDGSTLVATVLEELRTRRIVCPPLPTIERLGGTVRARARRQLWGRLADGLTDLQRRGLDQLLEVRSGGGQSTLAWLRQTAYAATTGNFPKLIDRLNQVRALGIESERATRVHQNYWLKLAREGGQSTVQHLAELEPLRRYATLTALALDLSATLTDEALNMFEHLVGKLFKKSERVHAEKFHANGKSINEKVRLYVQVGQALIEARSKGGDAFAAIETVLPWTKFESTVAEAQTLAQPEEFDYLTLLDDRYSSMRRFAPLLLEHFEFHAAPAATELLLALKLLRDLNASGKRSLPEQVPIGFVKPRWRPHVFKAAGVDLSKYEYIAGREEHELDHYSIYVYTPEMIVIEKLRAICQQMAEYTEPRLASARARDFFDIHEAISKRAIDLTTPANLELLRLIFEIKKVPLSLLSLVRNTREFHRPDWYSVDAGQIKSFDFYFDFVLVQIEGLKTLGVV